MNRLIVSIVVFCFFCSIAISVAFQVRAHSTSSDSSKTLRLLNRFPATLRTSSLIRRMGGTSSSEATSASGSLRAQLEQKITGNDVMIFSKTYCPYCTRAKEAIKKLNVQHDILELDVSVYLCFISVL